MSSPVAVVTDSAASLPPALARKWGIQVVPLHVIIDGEPHLEGEQVASEAVLEALVAGREVSTSQPSVAQFAEAFAAAASRGASHVVAVLISGKMSGTVSGARTAAQRAGIPVTVIDSQSLAMGTGFAAMAAAASARAGGSSEAVAQAATVTALSARCIFTVDTLEYLKRGGRVSPAIAAVGRVLNVRPVLELVEGQVEMVDRVRSTQRARSAVMGRAAEAVVRATRPAAAVMVLGDGEFGDAAARDLEAQHPDLAMLVRTPVSAVLATHTGPGTLAAVVVDLPDSVF